MGKMTDLSPLAGKRIYFDSNPLIYFLENDETFFESVFPYFKQLANKQFVGVASDLVLAELLVKPFRENDSENVETIKNLLLNSNYFEMCSHHREVFTYASEIRATQRLKMPDALHIATAILNDCDYFLTLDTQIINNATGITVLNP